LVEALHADRCPAAPEKVPASAQPGIAFEKKALPVAGRKPVGFETDDSVLVGARQAERREMLHGDSRDAQTAGHARREPASSQRSHMCNVVLSSFF
jgi:hypothetical protein